TDEPQHRHLPLGPLDAPDTLGRQAEIGHVVGGQDRFGGDGRSCSLRVNSRRSGAVRSAHGGPSRWMRRSSNRACSLYPRWRYALIAGGLSARTLSTTWSQLLSNSAVTAPVTAVAKPRPR